MSENSKSMITGSPARSLIMFALPMIAGQLCQQLYSLADTIIVGRTLGQDSLGAVGSSVSVCWVYISIALGLGMGCSVVISQLFGARNITRMRLAISTSIISMLALSLIFMAISLPTCGAIMKLMNVPPELLDDASTYYIIYVNGFPGLFLYNISNSIFNALGKSKIPLYFLAGSAVLNIGLDLLFILVFKWGVAGAAIATIASQYLAAILSFIVLLRYLKSEFHIQEHISLFDWKMLSGISKVAIPTMITQTILSVGITAMQSLVNTFGSDVMAGFTAASKVDGIAIVPMVMIGNAVSTYAAQNVGAKQYDRVPKGYHTALLMTTAVCLPVAAVLYIWTQPILSLFMDSASSAHAIQVGAEYVQIVCAFYIVMGFMNNTCGVLRGTGDIMPTMVALLVNFGVRIAFAYIMVGIFHSEVYIWWSNVIGWTIGLIISYIRYKSGVWRTKSVVSKVSEA